MILTDSQFKLARHFLPKNAIVTVDPATKAITKVESSEWLTPPVKANPAATPPVVAVPGVRKTFTDAELTAAYADVTLSFDELFQMIPRSERDAIASQGMSDRTAAIVLNEFRGHLKIRLGDDQTKTSLHYLATQIVPPATAPALSPETLAAILGPLLGL